MKVLIFGATGMVGQGVLRECLLDPNIEMVTTIGRSPTRKHHAKLHEIVRPDMFHYSEIEENLGGFDACFFCLGVSSATFDSLALRSPRLALIGNSTSEERHETYWNRRMQL